MGNEKAERIQTSFLNAAEKKALIWLAHRQPRWMTSDLLTYIGVLGAAICALGYYLSNYDVYWLWLSSFGLVVNWYGDSLDGTLARVRQLQRPKYGFFIDHSLDAITVCFMFLGGGLSSIFKMEVAMLMLIGYLVLSIYTYICTIIKDKFLLTYGGGFGPTEMRLVIILLNTVVMYTARLVFKWVMLRVYRHSKYSSRMLVVTEETYAEAVLQNLVNYNEWYRQIAGFVLGDDSVRE
jgi:phosphatidylglycerophosphate synthase